MCGIAGMLGPAAAREGAAAEIRAMLDRIRHRGPDGEGLVVGSGAVLGHVRLAIIDIEGGAQPMATPDGRWLISFNGEIYNFLELRQELTQQGVRFRTFSDTEVLLHLLAREGMAALPRLNGMFAFALVDTTTGQWWLARDHFGVKPLYMTPIDGAVLFASEIKALTAHPAVVRAVDDEALQDYFTFQFCLGSRTLFRGIEKLEPGEVVTGRGAEILERRIWWSPDFAIDEHHTEAWFDEQLRVLLEDAVRLQIRSDVPLGAHLSGGLDSSVIATLAASVLHTSVPTFHGRFAEGAAYDESRYADQVARAIGGPMHVAVPTAEEFVSDLPLLMRMLDEPVAGPGVFPQYRVSKLARDHVKVVLGGQGGDELFCGYARYLLGYLEQALKGAITRTTEEGRHIVTLSSIVPNLPTLEQYQPLMRQFWSRGLFEDMDRRYFWLINRAPQTTDLLHPDLLAAREEEAVFARFQGIFNAPGTSSYINKMLHFDQKTMLPALLQVEDRVSMAVGLESRVPLLDPRIAELAAAAPPAIKFSGGRTKHMFKQAVQHLLPREVFERRDKMGFPVPLTEWLRGGPVRDFVGDTLGSTAARQRGLYRSAALDHMVADPGAGARQLWGALCLEIWHRDVLGGHD